MMWWDHGWGWGDWLAMSLMMLAFWGLVIGLIVWLIRTTSSSSSRQGGAPPPLRTEDVLAERFARGEIDEVEYQERLRVLRGEGTGQPTRLDKTRAGR